MQADECKKLVVPLLAEKDIQGVENVLSCVKNWTKELMILRIFLYIYKGEIEGGLTTTVFDYSVDLSQLESHFIRVKLYLRRLEFELAADYYEEIYQYLVRTGVSDYFIIYVIQNNIFYKKRICQNLSLFFTIFEGDYSARARCYEKLAEDMKDPLNALLKKNRER